MNKLEMKQLLSLLLVLALALCTGYYLFFWRGTAEPAMGHPARYGGGAVVIDAGHGGEDGGAVSKAGNAESHVNLAIALRLDAILGLYGADVTMVRTEDVSLKDQDAATLRQMKVTDLHNRVALVESIPAATLISIHQNTYDGSAKYHGAQVFYTNGEKTLPFAQYTQEVLRQALDPSNTRKATKIPDTVYLMKHITCRAILVECGFLSNPAEDALLQTPGYQTKIASALAAAYLGYEEPERVTPNESQ